MVFDHQGEHGSQEAAIRSIASKIGGSGETLRNWVRRPSETRASGPGRRRTSASGSRHWILRQAQDEGETRELRQANEILRKASVFALALNILTERRLRAARPA